MVKNKRFLNVILVSALLISLIITINYLFVKDNSILVKSETDGLYYRVRDVPQKQELSNTFGTINNRIKHLLDHLLDELKDDDSLASKYKLNVLLLKSRYKPERFMENVELIDTSYTVNKGEKVVMCLMDREGRDEIYDINLLMYVALHELAHVGSFSYSPDHNKEFKDFFNVLIIYSVKLKIYEFVDYSENPVNYCGFILNTV